jgi:hypothetical protein
LTVALADIDAPAALDDYADVMTTKETAEVLCMRPAGVYGLVDAGVLKPLRAHSNGSPHVFRREDVAALRAVLDRS